jgi:hypothetical protein
MSDADDVTRQTLAAVRRFNEAFNRHDVDAVMSAMTADCVFENTRPTPDGTRIEGAALSAPPGWNSSRDRPGPGLRWKRCFAAGDCWVVRWKRGPCPGGGCLSRSRWEGPREILLCEGLTGSAYDTLGDTVDYCQHGDVSSEHGGPAGRDRPDAGARICVAASLDSCDIYVSSRRNVAHSV